MTKNADFGVGFALFNATLLWIWLIPFFVFIMEWPIPNAVGMATVIAVVCGIFVLPAFVLNAMAILMGIVVSLGIIVSVLIP